MHLETVFHLCKLSDSFFLSKINYQKVCTWLGIRYGTIFISTNMVLNDNNNNDISFI